jgi:hypothetical protein
VRLRINLNDSLLPQTDLVAQKSPDGGLTLAFTTDNPEAHQLLTRLGEGLRTHLAQTQAVPIHIQGANTQGQIFLQADASPNSGQNFSDQSQQQPKPDWESVEDRLKDEK